MLFCTHIFVKTKKAGENLIFFFIYIEFLGFLYWIKKLCLNWLRITDRNEKNVSYIKLGKQHINFLSSELGTKFNIVCIWAPMGDQKRKTSRIFWIQSWKEHQPLQFQDLSMLMKTACPQRRILTLSVIFSFSLFHSWKMRFQRKSSLQKVETSSPIFT